MRGRGVRTPSSASAAAAASAFSLACSKASDRVRLAVMSFGFKYGVPLDADLVFDMRFLPNPFWNPELRPFTGQDQVVSDFVLSQDGATEFLDRADPRTVADDKKLDEGIRRIVRQVSMEEIGKKPEVKVIISRLAAD